MRLNKLCNLRDWATPQYGSMPDWYPREPGTEHRKHWEFAWAVSGLHELGVLGPDSMVLGVGAGHEWPLYQLTNVARWVFATDIYGDAGTFSNSGHESDAAMLFDPDRFAVGTYNRRRLVVQHMNGADIRYEEGSFDAVFSLSSIEHFGEAKELALSEMARVLKPGGVLILTTECIINGADHLTLSNMELFTPAEIGRLVPPGCRLVEPIDWTVDDETRATLIHWDDLVCAMREGRYVTPHIVLELCGREFTSIAMFMRKG
jgi:SAM-dependent methyltransferase